MPKQFSTQAANADVMGEDAQTPGVPQGMPHASGADGTPREQSDRSTEREARGGEAKGDEATGDKPKGGEARPGKDINAAGFVKDKDKS